MLDDRGMSLSVNKADLIKIIELLINKMYLTKEEQEEFENLYDFEYLLDSFLNKYYQYVEIKNKHIVFDSEYKYLVHDFIKEEKNDFECDWIVDDVVFLLDNESDFLEILGVNINKELYNYLLNMDNELENMYMSLFDLELYPKEGRISKGELLKNIRNLIFKRMIFLINTKNLLSDIQYKDLVNYSINISKNNDDYGDVFLMYEDEDFDESDIMRNIFHRSIFTASDMYFMTLGERLAKDNINISDDIKYSKINFYLMFIELLEKEYRDKTYVMDGFNEIKYRLMLTLDTMYDLQTCVNRDVLSGVQYKENYVFAEATVYYFIKELLMYDDDKYRNIDYDADNMILYIDNLVKKIYIETYYRLTFNKKVIETIKNNEFYGVNKISSGFFDDIINKPKSKIKEV